MEASLIYLIPSGRMARLTATEVARNFSAIVNRVGTGETVEIVRNGVVVAELRPPSTHAAISADGWRELMTTLPPIDEGFAADVERAREDLPEPPADAWPS
jgi:antitoxin (DNA-binding transcriptional repressor) of toxin-antitoxin stability system